MLIDDYITLTLFHIFPLTSTHILGDYHLNLSDLRGKEATTIFLITHALLLAWLLHGHHIIINLLSMSQADNHSNTESFYSIDNSKSEFTFVDEPQPI